MVEMVYKHPGTNYVFLFKKCELGITKNIIKRFQLLHVCAAYQDDSGALRQHFKYSLLVCDMKRVFLLRDIMQWDLGRSVERPCTQKCNEPIVQKTLYCTLTYH